MTTDSIPMGEAVSWGWNAFKENAALLVAAQIVACLVPSFVEHFGKAVAPGFLEWIIDLASFVVAATLELGLIKIALRIHDGKPVEFSHLFDSFNLVAWFALAKIIAGFGIAIGLIFLIVPGIIVALRLWFIGYVTIDEHPNAIDAIQRSFNVSRGFTFDLFLFALLLIGINILGLLALVVGLFVSIPVSILATAYVFRRLKSRCDGLDDTGATAGPTTDAPVAPAR